MPKSLTRLPQASKSEIAPAKRYEAGIAEGKALAQFIGRAQRAVQHARAKVEVKGTVTHVSWHHPDQAIAGALWANSIGTGDLAFAGAVFEQVIQTARNGIDLTEAELNAMLALVRGLAPTDPTEALLIAQMAAVHNACMVAARRLTHADPEQHDGAVRAFTKLTRTFAAQVEALKNYRRKGEQIIKVQYVSVNDGGQAIVGDVQHAPAPGGSLEIKRQSDVLSHTIAPGPTLLGHLQADGKELPSPGGARETGVPLPRSAGRSTKGPRQRRLPARQLYQRGNSAAASRGPAAP